jgi:hypothetical protein
MPNNYLTTGIIIDSINLLSSDGKDESGEDKIKRESIGYEWQYSLSGSSQVEKASSITLKALKMMDGKEFEDVLGLDIDKANLSACLQYLIRKKCIVPTNSPEGILELSHVPYAICKLLFNKYITSFLLAYNLELVEKKL